MPIEKTDAKDQPTETAAQPPFYERIWFRAGVGTLVVVGLAAAVLSINFSPSLSHLKVGFLSGAPDGHYHAIVGRLAAAAAKQRGNISNISSRGSLDNVKRLVASGEGCDASFALVQDGLPWQKDEKVFLVARLPASETAFLLGRNADRVRNFADLRGMRIGIGPEGSGTAHLASQLFRSKGLEQLGLRLEHQSIAEQMKALRSGELDLGFFVIAEEARLIEEAVRSGMQIVGFQHAEALAQRLKFLRAATLSAGFYEPVRVLPPVDKKVLRVDTLVVGNGCASRSQTIGLLQLLDSAFPNFIGYNRSRSNSVGIEQSSAARDFLANRGPELMDQYAPWLVDLVPIGSLAHLVLVVSVLFNLMGAGNRFRLWRIDANRVNLENALAEFFGPTVLFSEIARLQPDDSYRTQERRAELLSLIEGFDSLKLRCRKYSVSMLVPMGQEMSYRYQESLLQERLDALRTFRGRL